MKQPARQPVQVIYGGAHLFTATTPRKLGDLALKALREHAVGGKALAKALAQPYSPLWDIVQARVVEKLEREPIEDLRIDFEDGYGYRPDPEEDGHAESSAREVALALAAQNLPPRIGIRIKSLQAETAARSRRTLERFVTTLVRETGGKLPPGFVVTLPKVVDAHQTHDLATMLAALESALALQTGSLRCELMIETPQVIFGDDGRLALRSLVEATAGRCRGVHFGTYDYTALLQIVASHQSMRHPACDFAKHAMQVALAGTEVELSDGATAVLPVGSDSGAVHAAWQQSCRDIQHSLAGGLYQGWDLHPAQLVVRYATVYAFFLSNLETMTARLKAFVDRAAQASRVGSSFDDAATGQGLLNFFARAEGCGAIRAEDVARTGLSIQEVRKRSFSSIVTSRRS